MANKQDKPDPEWDEIKAVLRAVGERLNAVGERLDAVGERLDAVARQQKENARQLDKQRQESDRRLAKTEQLLRDLARQVGGQDNRWGKIVESLVEGDLCKLLTKFLGIKIVDVSRRIEVRDVEIDLVAVNTDTVVVVEVKTTLEREHLDKFISTKLNRFTQLRPRYQGCKIYGVIAFVKVDSNAKAVIDYAIGKGLIVIKAMRGTNHIINPKGHKPHNFHP